jgi:hypothetical protein
MTPKEKAIDLYNKSYNKPIHSKYIESKKDIAIECALFATREIEEFMSPMVHSKQAYDYWEEVRQELINL